MVHNLDPQVSLDGLQEKNVISHSIIAVVSLSIACGNAKTVNGNDDAAFVGDGGFSRTGLARFHGSGSQGVLQDAA
jgi:TPP-dependent indolepyruvate ferredoxin oxidoreductase alpha subunit